MPSELTWCASVILFITCLQIVDGNSTIFVKDNITYQASDILENITTNSLLQCARRCSFFEECVGVELELDSSNCNILQSATRTFIMTNNEQYMKNACDEGWSIFLNSCYYITPLNYTWASCKDSCAAEGGHLATVSSEEESNFINVLREMSNIWIGGEKLGNNTWVWVNGEIWEYENWNPGEPEDKFCVRYFQRNSGWGDYGCSQYLHCTCEKTSL